MQLSATFLVFLAVLLPLYFILPRRMQPTLLLLGSLVFYAFAGWQSLCVLTLLCAVTYAVGRGLDCLLHKQRAVLEARRTDGSWDKATRRSYRDRQMRRVHLLLAFGVLFDLGLLLAFKCSLPAALGATDKTWLLPMGLSFVTLSAVGYLVDVARERIECEPRLLRFALFLFYFPQMWQGPISRYDELMPQLTAPHAFDGGRAMTGFLRALWGCIKKLVIADTVAIAVAATVKQQAQLGGTSILLLVVLYSVQIYGDFTGGMDIALGVSSVLGIQLYENFDRPFASPSLKEYWRRWHRSLGRWFTDYVFYPLSVCRFSQWLSRHARGLLGDALGKRIPLIFSMLLTWFATGLWHGATWNFMVWGLCNGIFLLISQELCPCYHRWGQRFPRIAYSRWWRCLLCVGTFLTVGLFRTLDLNNSAGQTLRLWGEMLLPSAWQRLFDAALWQTLGLNGAQWGVVALGAISMAVVGSMTPRLGERAPSLRQRIACRPLVCGALCAVAVAVLLVFGHYGIGYHANDFIYSQF